MLKWNIKKLPVVEERQLVGVVTLTDLLRVEGVIEALNGYALNGTSKRLKKAIEIYYDDGLKKKTKRCPMTFKDGMSIGCRLERCMWWTGEECAITIISRNIRFEKLNQVSCIAE